MKRGDHEQLVGRTIAGKYVVEGLIGTGAMGAVFRARQIALEKTVAIKVMHGEHASDPAFATRFHREAKAASRLNHPNSIQVLDFGAEADGLLYIAMEYIDGRSLHAVLRDEWPLTSVRIADILMQTLAALAIAHDSGVVHRDLKPENVMVLKGTDDDGRPKDVVKVCDFGIAKITDPRAYRGSGGVDSEAPVTTAGFLVGTPEYMSPEQGRGEKLDPRSDLYSVGVILFEMLTRRVPFEAENAIGIVLKHITEEPVPPSRLVPGIDARLEAVALRALRKFREERYPSAREMRAPLRHIVDGTTPGERGFIPDGSSLLPGAATPSLVNAATIAMPVPIIALHGSGPKPTLQGTTAAVARAPGRGRSFVLAALIAIAAGASGIALRAVRGSHLASGPAPAKALAFEPSPAPTPPPAAGPDPPTAAPTRESEPASGAHDGRSSSSLRPAARAKGGPESPAMTKADSGATPSASVAMAAPGSVASPEPAPPPAAPASAVASTTGSSGSAGPSAEAPAVDPTFNPDQAYVEVGMINAEGVKERAVRGALHGVALAQCYRASLRAKGARASGVATLNLSIDEGGLTRSAIVTGAEFLPGLVRCVQEASTGIRVPATQVDPGGGVAEITLGFREP